MNVSGTAEQVILREEPAKGNKKPWKKVSVKVKGEWYGGFVDLDNGASDDREKVNEGDLVTIEFTKNGRWMNIDTLTVEEKATSKVAQQQQTVSDYVPSSVRDLRITIAGARNSAIEFVRLALEESVQALTLPKGKNRADVLKAHVDHYTEVFARQLLTANDVDLLGNSSEPETQDGEDYSE